MQRETTIGIAAVTGERPTYGAPFYLILLYLALEYGRPQEMIPGFGSIHLPAVVTIFLAVALIASGRINLRDPHTRLFGALLVLMAVHIPFALNNYWALHTTRAMLITFVAYLAIVTFVDSFQKLQAMITAWIVIHTYVAIVGIMNRGVGTGGTLGDENDVALAINMAIPFAFFLALEARAKSKGILCLIITGIFLVCNAVTLSRGGFVGLIVVGLFCWLRAPRKIVSTVAVLLLAFSMVHFAPDKYWEEVHTILEEADNPVGTGQGRIHSWKAGWRMFLDYPILGVGPGNFPWHIASYEPPEGFAGILHGGRAAHSVYFTLIPELGIVGTILFAWMLYLSLKDLRFIRRVAREASGKTLEKGSWLHRKIDYVALALEGSLLGFLVSGAFLSALYYPNFWIWMGMVKALRRTGQESS
jgi:O-antigen ligase